MIERFAAVTVALLLAGCATQPTISPEDRAASIAAAQERNSALDADMSAITADCLEKTTNFTDFAVCSSTAELAALNKHGATTQTKLEFSQRGQETIRQAKRVDSGEISLQEAVANVDAWNLERQASVEAAELAQYQKAEAERRERIREFLLNSGGRTTTTNCTDFGYSVNCTTRQF